MYELYLKAAYYFLSEKIFLTFISHWANSADNAFFDFSYTHFTFTQGLLCSLNNQNGSEAILTAILKKQKY